MYILAIDTAGSVASAAILQDGQVISSACQTTVLDHSRVILPLTMAMLSEAGLTLDDIDVFAAAHGPGSFTGIRIGVSAIKGFSWARSMPCLGVSTLEAAAYCCGIEEGMICATLAARENEVFCGAFSAKNGKISRLEEDFCGDRDEIREKYSGYGFCEQHDASGVAKCAYEAAILGRTVSCHEIVPVYLKQTQAERMRLEREGKL